MTVINMGLHSWHNFVATAAKRLQQSQISGSGSSMSHDSDFSWTNGINLKTALQMAADGWQAGVQAVSVELDKLPPESEVLPDWNLSVAGAICNVPAFIAGESECMWQTADCRRDAKRLALVVHGIFSAGIQAKAAINYAIALAATVRYLEASGVDVAIYSVSNSKVTVPTLYGITVKEFGEPLDLSKVAFAFHPAFLRKIQFAWREVTPAACEANIAGQLARYGPPSGKLTTEDAYTLIGSMSEPVAILRGFFDGIAVSGQVQDYIETIKQDVGAAIARHS